MGWGDGVVERLAKDLQKEFPQTTGFSVRNLWYMRRFFEVYSTPEFLQQAVAELTGPRKTAKMQQTVAETLTEGLRWTISEKLSQKFRGGTMWSSWIR